MKKTSKPHPIQTLCQKGEKADQYYIQGRYKQAHDAYLAVLTEMEALGETDSYILGKVTLGLILTHIKQGQFDRALAIWTSEPEDSVYGIGIYSLEGAQTTVPDMVLYDFICAYLHSLCEAPPLQSGRAINQYMSRVCEFAEEHGDRALFALAISNWKQHLKDVFRGALPALIAQPVINFERRYGETVRLQAIDFPPPSPWERPADFAEFSRVQKFSILDFQRQPSAPPTPSTPSGRKKRSA